jgi:hypothetical protein
VEGFRTQDFYLITTLLDPVAYPASELAELYFQEKGSAWNGTNLSPSTI